MLMHLICNREIDPRSDLIYNREIEPWAAVAGACAVHHLAHVLDAQLEDIISAMESSVSDEGLELRESIKLRAQGEQML